jgi:hypothetical protein
MTDYDSSDLSGMVTKITSGATGALGNITMTDYDSSDLSGMVTKITSGATGALGDISMDGYSSDNITAMTTATTSGATGALGDIIMYGYDANTDNLSSSVTSGASAGGTFYLGSDNVSGNYYLSYNGTTPSDGCINDSTVIALYRIAGAIPSSASSAKDMTFLTSTTSGSDKWSFYSDSSCATLLGTYQYNLKNIVITSSITGLTAGSAVRPTSAYQVSYDYKDIITKSVGSDAATITFLNTKSYSGTAHTANVAQTTKMYTSGKNIWAVATSGSNTWFYTGAVSYANYPTDWGTYDFIYVK